MINKVTITGADHSIDPAKLADLSHEFPFVEWGILMSHNNFGTPRFPSLLWLKRLENLKKDVPDLKLSGHLCGAYVRNLVKGDSGVIKSMGKLWDIFDRIQLNFHDIPHQYSGHMIALFKDHPAKEFIFQYDGVNDRQVKKTFDAGCNVSALFDKSGGAGILPDQWPDLLDRIPCGYAGGLSVDNLEEQIRLIEEKAGNTEIWIDAETHLRSNMDALFDLVKVRRFLEISSAIVKSVV